MANKRSDWNDCLSLAAQLKQQSLLTQSPKTKSRKHPEGSDSIEQALEKLRIYQVSMQARNGS